MLPEPDLFSSVPRNIQTPDTLLYRQSEDNNRSAADVVKETSGDTNRSSTQQLEGLTHLPESAKCLPDVKRIKLRCPPPGWAVANVFSKPYIPSNNPREGSRDLRGRIAPRWYLTVIVLLYIGLITSFALNISLLLINYPEPSAPGLNLSKHQLKLDVSEHLKGINRIQVYKSTQFNLNTGVRD